MISNQLFMAMILKFMTIKITHSLRFVLGDDIIDLDPLTHGYLTQQPTLVNTTCCLLEVG